MKRITLQGDDLADFPENQESGYVKIRFPKNLDHEPSNTKKDYDLRSYTIRAFDLEKRELVLDFLLHGDSGPASKWASSVQIGDSIEIAGPGPAILAAADWYLFVGDMTALPAIAVNLEKLPSASKGIALLEINSLEDKQEAIHQTAVKGLSERARGVSSAAPGEDASNLKMEEKLLTLQAQISKGSFNLLG